MSVGKAILRIRQSKDMTQKEVAAGARLASSYLSRIENGHVQPTAATLSRVADAMGVPASDIFRIGVDDRVVRPHHCPVSASGDCVGEMIRSQHGRPPGSGRARYGKDELRLLRMADHLVLHGSKDVRKALSVLLESLMTQAGEPTGVRGPRRGGRRQ